MVDYSKWDSLDVSDDEADSKKPRVHRFEGPQQVTIGGPNREVQVAPSAHPQQGADEIGEASDDEPMEPPDEDNDDMQLGEDRREDVLQCHGLAERALVAGDASEAVRLLEKAMRLGGAQCPGVPDLLDRARRKSAEQAVARAGGEATDPPAGVQVGRPSERVSSEAAGGTVEGRYSWTQTPETVAINIFAPEGTKAKAVRVDVSDSKMCVTATGVKLLEGDWEFKVEPEEDPDWEVRDFEGRRVIRLIVRKAKMPGGFSMVVWWQRVLKGDPGIDVSSIDGRKKEKAESFAKAWEEAHVLFREKAQNREKVCIDVGDAPMEE